MFTEATVSELTQFCGMAMSCAELEYVFSQDVDWFPVQQWPPWAQEVFCKHKDHNQVWRFFAFLVNNGMEPRMAARWTTADSWVVGYGYDATRSRDLKHIVECLEGKNGKDNQELYERRLANVSYFDLSERRVIRRA